MELLIDLIPDSPKKHNENHLADSGRELLMRSWELKVYKQLTLSWSFKILVIWPCATCRLELWDIVWETSQGGPSPKPQGLNFSGG